MVAALTAQCAAYGNREAFTGVPVTVTRPNGSTFVQANLATYALTTLPPVLPADGRSSRHDGTPRKFASGGISNTLTQASRESTNRAFSVRESSRALSPTGLMWLVSVVASDGRVATVNRLRSYRAGRGGPWTYGPS